LLKDISGCQGDIDVVVSVLECDSMSIC